MTKGEGWSWPPPFWLTSYANSLLINSNLNYKVGNGGGDTTLIHKKGIVRKRNSLKCNKLFGRPYLIVFHFIINIVDTAAC